MSPGVRVKICGLKEPQDARAASRAGADYIGVVFAERLRRLAPERAAEVLAALEGRARGVGVFVDADAADILRCRDVAGFEAAQLHGDESPGACAALRDAGLEVWKAIRPRSRDGLLAAHARFAAVADAILVEGFSTEAAGGTGTGFPHAWLDDVARLPDGPALVLAGGLSPDNVGAAISRARPDVVDVSSGVERAPGIKSVERIEAFLAAVRAAAPSGRAPTPADA